METTTTTVQVNTDTAVAAGVSGVIIAIYLALIVFMIVTMWKLFTKAGKPGWASIIPIYNVFVMLKMAGKPGWWFLLLFVPFANFVIAILMIVALAERFGKGIGFAIGMMLIPVVFYPILAFGDATYTPVSTE